MVGLEGKGTVGRVDRRGPLNPCGRKPGLALALLTLSFMLLDPGISKACSPTYSPGDCYRTVTMTKMNSFTLVDIEGVAFLAYKVTVTVDSGAVPFGFCPVPSILLMGTIDLTFDCQPSGSTFIEEKKANREVHDSSTSRGDSQLRMGLTHERSKT